MRVVGLFCLFMFCLLLQRCTFEPSKEFLNKITPPGEIALNVEVNVPDFQDPYMLLQWTQFTFTIKHLQGPILATQVLVGSTEVPSTFDATGVSFYLSPFDFNEGTHAVKIRIFLATNTGSLAERIGAEAYAFETDFSVIIDRTPPPTINPTASFENGLLTLRWEPISQKNFTYRFRRNYESGFWNDSTFVANGESVFIDRGYVGGTATYHVSAEGPGFQKDLGDVSFDSEPVDFTLAMDDKRVVSLSWTKSDIEVNNVVLQVSVSGRNISKPLTTSASFVIDTLELGEEQNYWMQLIRKHYSQSYTRIEQLKMNPNLKPFKTHAYLSNENKLLTMGPTAIYRYSLPDFVLEDSLTTEDLAMGDLMEMVASFDQERVIVASKTAITGFDAATFDNVTAYTGLFAATMPYATNDEIREISLGTLSNNGSLAMLLHKESARNYPVVYNVNSNTVTWYPYDVYVNYPPVISFDDTYVVTDVSSTDYSNVYSNASGSYEKIGRVRLGVKYFREGTSELINTTYKQDWNLGQPSTLDIYDLSDAPSDETQSFDSKRSKLFESPMGNEYLWAIEYDPTSDVIYSRYMYEAMSAVRTYDPVTFQQKKMAKCFTYSPYSHKVAGEFHLTNRGFIEKMK